jgi:hypothetical protein
MDVDEWRHQLEAMFTRDGVRTWELVSVRTAEAFYEQFVESACYTHTTLVDSFLCFVIETVNLARAVYPARPPGTGGNHYGLKMGDYVSLVRSIRAAEALFRNGYPLDGFGEIRDVHEQAVLLAGVASGLTTFARVNGLDALRPIGPDTGSTIENARKRYAQFLSIRRARRVEQRNVIGRITGEQSGLTPDTIFWLAIAQEMFNLEVHGSRLTATEHQEWLMGHGPLPIDPKPKRGSISIYVNRCEEACWMWHRLLPLLQLRPRMFGASWVERWGILDESFRFQADMLTKMNKPIGAAIIELLDTKFAFGPDSVHV